MPLSTSIEEDDVLFENVNSTKIITLNRPKKLNSLNTSMIQKIYPRLKEYAKSDLTDLIIQKQNGRAFCAGGDVSACVEANEQGKSSESTKFFQQEYSLNYLYAGYPKPVVSLMNGITFGGGVGLSIHNPFRIATENTRWAMPEMDIGFFPDVGTTFALNKLIPSSLGWYLALTGEHLFGKDVYFSGLATHYIPSSRLSELIKALCGADLRNFDSFSVVGSVIEDFTEPLPQDYKFKYSVEQLQLIEKVFNPQSTIESIVEDLKNDGSEFALKTAATLQTKSPLSLKVGLELLQRGSQTNIHETLNNELHSAKHFMADSDFNEGVSSKLIRKSKELPNWKHKSPAEITVKEILPYFKADSSLVVDKNYPATYTDYPYNFGLPKETEVRAFIDSKPSGTVTVKDVITHFTQDAKYKHKSGLIQYLKLVISSKSTGVNKTLEWKL